MIPLLNRQHLVTFYILAFLITWLAWLPQAAYSRGLFPFDSFVFYLIGGIGPMLAAYFVLRQELGEAAYSALFAPLFRRPASVLWVALAVVLPGLLAAAGLLLSGDLPGSAPIRLPAGLLLTFLTYFLAAVPEEIAWRGFVLPRLARHGSALSASLIIGLLWALWHLPLLFNINNSMSRDPVLLFILEVTAASVIYSWLFIGSGGSVLIVTLYHALINTVGAVAAVEPWAEAVIMVTAAALVTLLFGPARLSHNEKALKEWI